MKNTELIFHKAKEYQDKRTEINSEYDKKMQSLESAKGSRFFEIESQKATEKRDTGLKALKKDFCASANVILSSMAKVNASRTFEAPTAEEVAILDALKMREKVSEGEIMKAGNTLKSPLAIEVLREIAKKNGYIRHIDGVTDTEMTMNEAGELINALSQSINDFVDHDTSKAARAAQEHKELRYGLSEEDNKPLPKRETFDTIEGFFDQVCPYMSPERRTAFCKAVDGE